MFKVERSDFVSHFWNLTRSGSVLLSGAPGVGKSWTIGQLIRLCRREGRPHVALAAEDFDVASLNELNAAVGFKKDIVSVLGSLGTDPLLIIDGLDSLRGEASQRAFRELISGTVKQVPNCSIVASIRTFDLQQSEELQQLFFPSASGTRGAFTHLTVEPFADSDLQLVCAQIPAIERLLRDASPEMQIILRNPFNLHIAVRLIEGGMTAGDLSAVHSEVQLLGKYWHFRVEAPDDGADRKAMLRRIVREMVRRNSLSVAEQHVYSPGFATALKELRSCEVLRESVTDRISFAHNILFDYGVARLVLDEEEVFRFIDEDSTRTIFFRPSLSYFFHYLWWKNREFFWKIALKFFGQPGLPERARVIPAVVLTDATRSLADLQPLLEEQTDGAIRGISLALRSLQAFGSMQSPRRQMWLALLDRLSEAVRLDFINEYIALLSAANVSRAEGEVPSLGMTARRLLLWMWKKATELPARQSVELNTVAISRVFPIAMSAYGSDQTASRGVVECVLDRLGLRESSPNEAFWLSHEIKNVIDHDPQLAVSVYQRMFAHYEESEERTVMGGSLILPMVSSRRQDFEAGIYGLTEAFQHFIAVAPEHASLAAVLATNAEIKRTHPPSEQERGAAFLFEYRGRTVRYVPDFSEIWDQGVREHQSLQLLTAVLQAAGSKEGSEKTISTIAYNAEFAVCWKRMLEATLANIGVFHDAVRPLLAIPQFIAAPEVTVAAGNVLKAALANDLITAHDQTVIEAAILAIPQAKIIVRYEEPESIQNRLLLCIGSDRLKAEELKRRAQSIVEKQQYENRPFVQIEGSSFAADNWLGERGIDMQKPENAAVQAVIKDVSEFEHRFLNKTPSLQDTNDIEPRMRHLVDLLGGLQMDSRLSEGARGALCAAAETILRNAALPADSAAVQFCRDIVLRGAHDPSPTYDPKYHSSFDTPSWGSPLARIEAAQGVAHLLWNYGPDQDIVQAIQVLAKDAVPAVRFQVATALLGFYKHQDGDRFWALVQGMLTSEATPGVMLGLLETLGRVAGREPERVVKLLTQTVARGLPVTERSEMTRTLVQILTGLYVVQGNESSNKQLEAFESSPVRFKKEIGDEVYIASHYLVPQNGDSDVRRRAGELLARVLNASYLTLDQLSAEPETPDKGEKTLILLQHVDSVATRVFSTLHVDEKIGGLSDNVRAALYRELKPLLALLARGPHESAHRLLPHAAHYLLETLNSVLKFDPADVIKLAAEICSAGSQFNYEFDQMAVGEIVKLVDRMLADYKSVLQEREVADSVGSILDIFVKAGWPEAMQLTFRLDQAVR
jgi:hypothetical protein